MSELPHRVETWMRVAVELSVNQDLVSVHLHVQHTEVDALAYES